MKLQRCIAIVFLGIMVLFVTACGEEHFDPEVQAALEDPRLALAPVELSLQRLLAPQILQVAQGSYLVNAAGGCAGCHSADAGYLAGGTEFTIFPDAQGFPSVITPNLTPDPGTGLQLTEAQFIEAIRTGKDFTDSTETEQETMFIMPYLVTRFLSAEDLKSIYAYLKSIPPVANEVRKTFDLPFPAPPTPFPAALREPDLMTDPHNAERGLRIPAFFSSGPDADMFVAEFDANVAVLSLEERTLVGRGSYLVNAIGACSDCHTAGDFGRVEGTTDVNVAAYLSGGVNVGRFAGVESLFSRNLTPDPDTGLIMSEEKFIELMTTGVDSRRARENLRIEPHFPPEYRFTEQDLRSIYAYLRTIPGIDNGVEIVQELVPLP